MTVLMVNVFDSNWVLTLLTTEIRSNQGFEGSISAVCPAINSPKNKERWPTRDVLQIKKLLQIK